MCGNILFLMVYFNRISSIWNPDFFNLSLFFFQSFVTKVSRDLSAFSCLAIGLPVTGGQLKELVLYVHLNTLQLFKTPKEIPLRAAILHVTAYLLLLLCILRNSFSLLHYRLQEEAAPNTPSGGSSYDRGDPIQEHWSWETVSNLMAD